MYSASFIYEPGQYDDEFNKLNTLINEIALATEGYIGQESWKSRDGNKVNATYYWESFESLKVFSTHPKHIEAKRQYKKWYQGFHIVISEVIKSYGDGFFEHVTPNSRSRAV
jgi:heme-degrading monooxygenase HmoA